LESKIHGKCYSIQIIWEWEMGSVKNRPKNAKIHMTWNRVLKSRMTWNIIFWNFLGRPRIIILRNNLRERRIDLASYILLNN